jgi:hypothetical protein
MITLDFIVIQDCARKFIHTTLGPGNGEWLHSKNIHPNWNWNFFADIQTICRDCGCRVGGIPTICVGVEYSFSLNSIDSL